MKRIIVGIIILFSLATFAHAQCDESLMQQALKEMGDSQYIKDFGIDLKKAKKDGKTGEITFKVILNSRNRYKFNIVNESSNKEQIIMQLFDGDRLLISNFDNGKMYKAAEFICRTTKAYNLSFSFKNGEEGCASAILSLVKQYNEGEMGF